MSGLRFNLDTVRCTDISVTDSFKL